MPPKTRFVILSQPRTGGTLAAHLLDSHPEIRCDGEVFNVRYGHFPAWVLRGGSRFPDPYFMWSAAKANESVYGCKLMVYDVKRLQSLISRLGGRGWHIVHVARRDVLGAALSDAVARMTDHWHRWLNDPPPNYVVRVDPDVVLRQLAKREGWSALEQAVLAHTEHVALEYSRDLATPDRWDSGLAPVLRALQVQPAQMVTDLARTDDRPLEDVVENLPEVLAAVTASRWSAAVESFGAGPDGDRHP